VLRLALMPPAFPTAQSIATFHDGLRAQLESIPGAEAAGAVSMLPLSGLLARADFTIDGRPAASPEDTPSANYRIAGPGYFRAMRIPLVSGRDFADTDTAASQRIAIVSQALARRFWPDGGAAGAHLHIDGFGSGEIEIAGVAGDVQQSSLSDQPAMDLYLPYAQAPHGALVLLRNNMYWVIRARNPLTLAQAARRAVHATQKDVAVSSAMPLEHYLRATIAPRKFNLVLLAAFAVSALLLAVISVYGVMAHSVTLRTREIGLRMALGAQPSDVLLLVLRQGLVLTVSGVGVGVAGALAVSRLLSKPPDVATFAVVAVALTVAGLLASFVPALRATRVCA
jgi:putative ABC transport system permease protein